MKDKESGNLYSALWRALIFIQNNLDRKISLDDIADISGYSPYHFHRAFKKFTGESVNTYVKRLQLENAAFRLRIKNEQVIDVALDSGYYTHETFTRAFKKYFGTTPHDYRRKISVQYSGEYIDTVNKVLFKSRRCIFMRYTGSYEQSGTPVDRNSQWQKLMKRLPEKYWNPVALEFFGISHDDPAVTSTGNIRYDACIALPEDLNYDHLTLEIPGGMYLEALHSGPFTALTDSYHYLLDSWSREYNLSVDHNRAPFEKFEISESEENLELQAIRIYIPVLE